MQRFVPVLLFAGLLTAGCATKAYRQADTLQRDETSLRVVLMPIDVELGELTAGGLVEPNAEWTALARTHIRTGLVEKLESLRAEVAIYVPSPGEPQVRNKQVQLVKLHEAVGKSILLHKYQEGFQLPTKQNIFDWSLGPAAAILRREYDADYALFIYLRDSYSSAGRVAASVLTAVLFGYALPGGQQIGFASLVDLDTGSLVWFNRLARATGDVRELDAARATMDLLLADLPQ